MKGRYVTMSRLSRRVLRPIHVSAVGFALACAAVASARRELTGRQIIEKFVQATGGKEAYEKLKTRSSTGTFAIPAQNITGQITLLQEAPDRMNMSGQVAGVTFARGFDGRVAYEVNSAAGARIIEGDERDLVRQQAMMNPILGLDDFVTSIENVGVEQLDGREAHKIELTMTGGQMITEWFDAESALLTRLHMAIDSLVGPLEITIDFDDWREQDGIKIPFKMEQRIDPMGIEQTIEFTEIKSNVEIPAEKFALPEEVKDLLADAEPATQPATTPASAEKK